MPSLLNPAAASTPLPGVQPVQTPTSDLSAPAPQIGATLAQSAQMVANAAEELHTAQQSSIASSVTLEAQKQLDQIHLNNLDNPRGFRDEADAAITALFADTQLTPKTQKLTQERLQSAAQQTYHSLSLQQIEAQKAKVSQEVSATTLAQAREFDRHGQILTLDKIREELKVFKGLLEGVVAGVDGFTPEMAYERLYAAEGYAFTAFLSRQGNAAFSASIEADSHQAMLDHKAWLESQRNEFPNHIVNAAVNRVNGQIAFLKDNLGEDRRKDAQALAESQEKATRLSQEITHLAETGQNTDEALADFQRLIDDTATRGNPAALEAMLWMQEGEEAKTNGAALVRYIMKMPQEQRMKSIAELLTAPLENPHEYAYVLDRLNAKMPGVFAAEQIEAAKLTVELSGRVLALDTALDNGDPNAAHLLDAVESLAGKITDKNPTQIGQMGDQVRAAQLRYATYDQLNPLLAQVSGDGNSLAEALNRWQNTPGLSKAERDYGRIKLAERGIAQMNVQAEEAALKFAGVPELTKKMREFVVDGNSDGAANTADRIAMLLNSVVGLDERQAQSASEVRASVDDMYAASEMSGALRDAWSENSELTRNELLQQLTAEYPQATTQSINMALAATAHLRGAVEQEETWLAQDAAANARSALDRMQIYVTSGSVEDAKTMRAEIERGLGNLRLGDAQLAQALMQEADSYVKQAEAVSMGVGMYRSAHEAGDPYPTEGDIGRAFQVAGIELTAQELAAVRPQVEVAANDFIEQRAMQIANGRSESATAVKIMERNLTDPSWRWRGDFHIASEELERNLTRLVKIDPDNRAVYEQQLENLRDMNDAHVWIGKLRDTDLEGMLEVMPELTDANISLRARDLAFQYGQRRISQETRAASEADSERLAKTEARWAMQEGALREEVYELEAASLSADTPPDALRAQLDDITTIINQLEKEGAISPKAAVQARMETSDMVAGATTFKDWSNRFAENPDAAAREMQMIVDNLPPGWTVGQREHVVERARPVIRQYETAMTAENDEWERQLTNLFDAAKMGDIPPGEAEDMLMTAKEQGVSVPVDLERKIAMLDNAWAVVRGSNLTELGEYLQRQVTGPELAAQNMVRDIHRTVQSYASANPGAAYQRYFGDSESRGMEREAKEALIMAVGNAQNGKTTEALEQFEAAFNKLGDLAATITDGTDRFFGPDNQAALPDAIADQLKRFIDTDAPLDIKLAMLGNMHEHLGPNMATFLRQMDKSDGEAVALRFAGLAWYEGRHGAAATIMQGAARLAHSTSKVDLPNAAQVDVEVLDREYLTQYRGNPQQMQEIKKVIEMAYAGLSFKNNYDAGSTPDSDTIEKAYRIAVGDVAKNPGGYWTELPSFMTEDEFDEIGSLSSERLQSIVIETVRQAGSPIYSHTDEDVADMIDDEVWMPVGDGKYALYSEETYGAIQPVAFENGKLFILDLKYLQQKGLLSE